ncbi:MAG: fibronectin type III domain-containing protein, partial [Gammaproteobacteria bacterium]|nr:fibronectin type III domain-containing protein [Gammaproteobacteria bacterium]
KNWNDLKVTPPSGSGFPITILTDQNISTDILQNIILPLPDTTAPKITSQPLITSITDTTATVIWKTDEPATSLVYYGEGSSINLSESITAYTRDHSVLLTQLTANTQYSVQANSSDANGNGPIQSETVTFTTLSTPDTTAPTIIAGPIITEITHNSAIVEWETDEMTTAQINYGLGSDLSSNTSVTQLGTHHKVLISSLDTASKYSVQVNVTDNANNGPTTSNIISFTTLAAADTTAPVIISGPIVVDLTDTAATIIWTTDEPATSGVSYNDGTSYGIAKDDDLSIEHKVRLNGLTSSLLYNYTVSSSDKLGNGPTLSQENSFTTLPEPDTEAPVITEAINVKGITHQSALIKWRTDESSSALIKYGLSSDNLSFQKADTKEGKEHNPQLTDLQKDTTYYFTITMIDVANNKVTTEVNSFKTRDLPDTAAPSFATNPTVLKTTNDSAVIGWETDEPTSFQFKYGQGSDRSSQQSSKEKKTKHQAIIPNLEANKTYGFEVISTDTSSNESSYDSDQ